jgi:hypothetical protein
MGAYSRTMSEQIGLSPSTHVQFAPSRLIVAVLRGQGRASAHSRYEQLNVSETEVG